MKIKITLSALFAMLLGVTAYSQTEKIIEPEVGFLNDIIMSDTAADGTREDIIYVLRCDAEYLVSGAFANYGWKLHIKAEDGGGERPIIRVYQDDDGSIPWAMTTLYGDLELESIFIDAQPSTAEQSPAAWAFVSYYEGAELTFDDCIFYNIGQGAIGVWNAASTVTISNCKFYNMGNISFWDLGNGRMIDCRSSQVDQMTIKNNTIVNSVDRIVRHRGGAGIIKNLVFDHNTIVNNAGYHGFIELGNVGHSIQITNNLIVDGMSLGADQSDVTRLSELDAHGETDGSGNPMMVWVGSIPNDSTTFTMSKNIYSVSSELQAFYTAQGVDEGPDHILTQHIKAKLGDDSLTAFVKKDVALANIPAVMTEFCTWYYAADGANKQKVTTAEVDYNRKTYRYWLDEIDCSYVVSDDLLGTDDIPVGDTNRQERTTGIREVGQESIDLINYPNPFAESTTLQFSLKQSAAVTLQICDLTGRTIQQIDAGLFTTGVNKYVLHKGNMKSGVYLIKIEANSYYGIKKIVIE